MFALQPAPTMGTVVAPWSGSMIDRLSSLEDMPPKDNVISMKNIPCLGVTGSGGDVGAEGITTGKAATAVLDPTTAEATATPHASTYFASTYYHLNDDELNYATLYKVMVKWFTNCNKLSYTAKTVPERKLFEHTTCSTPT
ncbi:hypothetical protein GQX74_011375 [Glossina fuscipes]|nr:hypothetical protein GQX74_011375 [Glossina fuscipes]